MWHFRNANKTIHFLPSKSGSFFPLQWRKLITSNLLQFIYFASSYPSPLFSPLVLYHLPWSFWWTEEPGRLQSMRSLRVRHDWATSLSFFLSWIGEGNGNPLQCSCVENPRDGEGWWAAVYGVAQSRTWRKRLSSSSSSKCLRIILL